MILRFPGFGPSVQPIPEPVDRQEIADQVARERARELRQRRGRASTILTSPLGVQEQAQETNIRRPSLLGE